MCFRRFAVVLAIALPAIVAVGCGQTSPPPGGGMPPFAGACILATQPCLPTADHPTPRSEFATVYDEVGRQMIVYGGSTAVSMGCNIATPVFVEEVFAYDDLCGNWRRIGATGPGPRTRMMATYDSVARRMIVFGGRWRAGTSGAYTIYGDLWALDLATEQWSMIDAGGAGGPAARASGGLVFDAAANRVWLVGGDTSASGAAYTPNNDVWSYDLAAGGPWQAASPAAPLPPARVLFGATFDSSRARVVVFGGADQTAFTTGAYMSDLWAYDTAGGAWTQLDPGTTNAPSGRFMNAIAYDPTGDRYLGFAGHTVTNLGNANDLWRFDAVAGGWSVLRAGDAFNQPITTFCMPPTDFATVDLAAPERRSSLGWVLSPACGHALVFGGKTDCGAIDDVWAWDFGSAAWQEAVPASAGEVCLRYQNGDPTSCAGLCN